MADSRWPRVTVLLLASAAIAGVAGCGSPASHPPGSRATQSASMTAQTVSQRAARLRAALLARINGVPAAGPPAYGSYASLPVVTAAGQPAPGDSVTPRACAHVTLTGLDPAALADAPAAAVTFRVGQNEVSEVLVTPPGSVAASALRGGLPAGCARYQATVNGATVRYTARESAFTGIGAQARVLNVQTAGRPADDAWSMVYRGSGFLGAVTVVGPNASELVVSELGKQAYAYAAMTLS